MSDIYQWLSALGLEQYQGSFEANDIDMEVLGELSESDLKALDVSLGHRKKILKAISHLSSDGSDLTKQVPGPATAVVPEKGDPERRYMTIMFSDLADSTLMAATLDIEDMHDLNRAYQKACAQAIRKFGGFVARYMGDGVLAYFGYPTAAENDAERAVWAGMEISHRISELNQQFTLAEGLTLSVRIGIASGSVVVETIGDDLTKENAVVGEAPNLAARLQALASPDSILVGPDTHRLVTSVFEFTDLGEKSIKGYDDPIQVWQVRRERPIEQRFRIKYSNHLTPLIGRAEELALLAERWQRTKNDQGQVVLLSGEAGMGKTRLIDALLEQVEQLRQPRQLLRFYCSPYHTQSPLHPFLANLMRESGILPDDDDETQFLKLRELVLEKYKFDENILHTLTSLIALKVEGQSKTFGTDPQRQLQLVQEGLIDFVINLSTSAPVLMVVEDTHWIDPTSLKVLDLITDRSRSHAVMLLLSHRPDKPLRYTQSHVTHLSLSKLTTGQTGQLIAEISNSTGLDDSVIHSISHRSAGIPLFIEEVTKFMLDTRNRQPGSSTAESTRVPDTLHASLLAILDRSGKEKYLAQCASVIGDVFEKMMLGQISELPDTEIDSGIEKLVAQNIVHPHSGMKDSRFRFRHALLRDAAYESLLKNNRIKMHAAIAQFLSRPDLAGPAPGKEVIAYHYAQARDDVNAFKYWVQAGETAFNSGATVEAVELLKNAVLHLSRIDHASVEPSLVYRLYMTRGRALNASLGAVSEEAHESFRHAVSIAHQMVDIEKEIDALDWEFGITFNAGRIRKSVILAQSMLDIGTENEHIAARISGHQALGMAWCALGEFENAQHHLESALDTQGQKVDGLNCYPSMSLDYLSFVKYCVGDRKSATLLCHQAIESARQESDYATAAALSNSCFTRMLLGDTAMVRDYSEQVIRLAHEHGQHMFINRGLLFQNLATAWIEQDPLALEQVVEATDTLFDSREEIDLSCLIGMTAEIQIILADYSAAQASLERALALSEKNEERFYLAELYRLESELILGSTKRDSNSRKQAKKYLDKAMQVATQQNAGGWIARINQSMEKITCDAW